jgi:hypothetical protein
MTIYNNNNNNKLVDNFRFTDISANTLENTGRMEESPISSSMTLLLKRSNTSLKPYNSLNRRHASK